MKADLLVEHAIKQAGDASRFIIAVAGPPGSGKSTLAEKLQLEFLKQNQPSKVIPMDGFHLDNSILTERGLLSRKGSPETFDVDGFIHQISRLRRQEGDVFAPIFDRDRDIAIAGAELISTDDRFLIVEGNYLFLKQEPWFQLQTYWNETVFINTPMEELEKRLVQRWIDHGLEPEMAQKRALENDIPNAQYVLKNSLPANLQYP